MPKTGAPTSHEAIKRSLKSKFKLILSENRILVDTINGYVKKAEKVYKEMESTDDVTPKQFAKAMEKLERAYSACVRLILVASDLFEKGDSEGMTTRETATSSCESETSVYSSESSGTITDSNRARKLTTEKPQQKRSRSSDVKVSESVRAKAKAQPPSRKSRMIELADTSKVETSNAASERLFVRSGSCSEFDHLIELQRFLHGLEREKLQTDLPNVCVAVEKQPLSYQAQRDHMAGLEQTDTENKQESPEEVRSQSITQRLKILKSAIENLKDRSSGDERVHQALNDIRELVLNNKDVKENFDAQEAPPAVDSKGGANIQASPVSDSVSSEMRKESGSKVCNRGKGDHVETVYKSQALEQTCEIAEIIPQNKLRESSTFVGKTQQGYADERKMPPEKYPQPSERTQKVNIIQRQEITSEQQKTAEHQQQLQNCDAELNDEHQGQESPAISLQVLEDDKDDINHIIVNKIVDMVSAKLAPRLRVKNGEDRGGYHQFRAEKAAENCGLEDAGRYARSPTHLPCQEISFPQNHQQGSCCGNFSHFPQPLRHHFQQQLGQQQQQQEMLNPQRRQQRPKMVSFMDDYEDATSYNSWNSKLQNDSRKCLNDSPPTQMAGPYMYNERELEQPSHYHTQQISRFSSPHKKRPYNMQQPFTPQRINEHQPKQGPTLRRKLHEEEDIDAGETEVELYKDGAESEQADESDSELGKEYPQFHQLQDLNSKSTPSHESLSWANRSLPKNYSSLETSECRTKLQPPRGRAHQQQATHNSDSFDRKMLNASPNSENHQMPLKDAQEREWFSSSQTPAEADFLDGSKARQNETDALNRLQHRFGDTSAHDQRQEEFAEWRGTSIDEHFSDNSEWAHNQSSPKPVVTHSQQQSDAVRPFPVKMPRSTPPKVQPHRNVSSYTNCVGNTGGYAKFKGNDIMRQASETSCEASPAFSTDDRLQTDTVTIRDEPEGKDTKIARPEVVCIDTNQLHADASRTITLSNLPLDMEETELLDIFKKYGHVTKIYYIKDRNTGMFQGRAYGKFSKASEAYQAAQDLQNLVLDGHEVCVQLYVTTP